MKRVLLVDDDSIFNFLSSKTLQRMGLASDIHMAVNGAEALQLFNDYYQGAKALPDVILLDLNMPIMNGFGFLEAFRRLRIPGKEHVKIFIVSSSDNPGDRQRAKELGADYYLTKPLQEQSLRLALEMG
ncbi:response regulator [Parachryseolinea silvisoli]|uniref:response regulator n=1 Tax=Parachryseolinea silvisoli TaxID=2873601 RepID=UPI0022658B99|nr:response regulator [Parachryseolinea silvisoli]MCD9017010.1 response regulator [Parachryseolinea silvisoli]